MNGIKHEERNILIAFVSHSTLTNWNVFLLLIEFKTLTLFVLLQYIYQV